LYAGFDATLPAEWESWLRHRRDDPPTPEQVAASLAEAEMKKINAAKLEEKRIKEFKEAVSCVGLQLRHLNAGHHDLDTSAHVAGLHSICNFN
jgi:NADH:ubiquinone oxidoreductase subunit